MPELPERPDLEQLRRQAKELLRAAKNGDADAIRRIKAVDDRLILSSAQLAVARDYGFQNWAALKTEVERREILNSGDPVRLARLLSEQPELAVRRMDRWCDHTEGATPLGYVTMLKFDARRLGLTNDLSATGEMARTLIAAGAQVNGGPDDGETPLIGAASYGDADVARVLIEAGADVEATASENSGGIPGGTALRHAAVYGMTEVVDVLAAANAQVNSISEAAAVGDVSGWLDDDTPTEAKVGALVMAADHQRLNVIDALVDAGTPIDAEDAYGRQALRIAARNGRAASVERLLARGADPDQRDAREHRTALEWCLRAREESGGSPGHDQVVELLRPVTS
jgi:ankyrin repeat protein